MHNSIRGSGHQPCSSSFREGGIRVGPSRTFLITSESFLRSMQSSVVACHCWRAMLGALGPQYDLKEPLQFVPSWPYFPPILKTNLCLSHYLHTLIIHLYLLFLRFFWESPRMIHIPVFPQSPPWPLQLILPFAEPLCCLSVWWNITFRYTLSCMYSVWFICLE